MTRIAVIGNSHTGALRRAWDAVAAERPDIEAVIYAMRPGTEGGYGLVDGRYFGPSHSGSVSEKTLKTLTFLNGNTHADLAGAEWIFQVGVAIGQADMMELLAESDVDGLRLVGRDTRVSAAAFDVFLKSTVRLHTRNATEWSQPLGLPHIVIPPPRLAESALDLATEFTPLKADTTGLREAVERLEAEAAALLNHRGQPLLLQPGDTIGPLGLTDETYSCRGEPHGKRDTSGDYKHMNALFGKRMWAEMIALTEA